MAKALEYARTHKKFILAAVAALVAGGAALGHDLSFLNLLVGFIGL